MKFLWVKKLFLLAKLFKTGYPKIFKGIYQKICPVLCFSNTFNPSIRTAFSKNIFEHFEKFEIVKAKKKEKIVEAKNEKWWRPKTKKIV